MRVGGGDGGDGGGGDNGADSEGVNNENGPRGGSDLLLDEGAVPNAVRNECHIEHHSDYDQEQARRIYH